MDSCLRRNDIVLLKLIFWHKKPRHYWRGKNGLSGVNPSDNDVADKKIEHS